MLDAWRKVRAPASAKARPRASPVGTLGGRNPEIVATEEKMPKLPKPHHAIDAGGPRVIIAILRPWIGFTLGPNKQYRMTASTTRTRYHRKSRSSASFTT